ncbi:MAG: succinylglutamate desuccinylase/aspartoacylase family protein [Halobacteriaceae archaeon]
MEIGSVKSEPGTVSYGHLSVTDLPTGVPEKLPVIIADGNEPGPTLWITGGIHGDEATGLAVAQDVITDELPSILAGTVVCMPSLNPAGLRQATRQSYYHNDDPNRYFPDVEKESTRPPRVQEIINSRIYDEFANSADALIDMHTAQVGSVPFVIRDRVLYGEHREQSDATLLADELNNLVNAFDLPIVNEYEAEEYTEKNLQRSTAGAALNNAGIPAFTVELGSHSIVEEDLRQAGVAGCYRTMVELNQLDSYPRFAPADDEFPDPVDYAVKRARHPYTETPGIVRYQVQAGETVESGDEVADIVTEHGRHKSTITTDHDGYVLGRYQGIAKYENDPLLSMAVRDEGDLVVSRENS